MSERKIELPRLPRGKDLLLSLARSVRYDRVHAKKERPRAKPRRYLSSLFKLGSDLDDAIFIVGAPRSGTTFLGTCMHSLRSVSYHFEPITTKIACAHVYDGWDGPEAKRYFRRVYRALMLSAGEGGLRLCDKTPQHSFIIPFLSRAFPRSKFIHITRNGLDAALSLRERKWLNADQESGSETGGFRLGPNPRFWVEPERVEEFRTTTDLGRCIWSWRRHTEAALQAGQELPKDRYHEIRYEGVAKDPERAAEGILDFLSVEDSVSRRQFREAVGGVHSRSIGRWKNAMSDEELELCLREAGPTLKALGVEISR